MNIAQPSAMPGSSSARASRRGLLATATAGLLAATQFANAVTVGEAKKKRNHRRGKKKDQKKIDNTRTRVDAICLGPTDNSGLIVNKDSSYAQTFTAVSAGRLDVTEIFISVFGTGPAELTLQLRNVDASGVPAGEVLAETSVAMPDVPNGELTIALPFVDPPPVTANREYALVLSKSGPRDISWKGNIGDTCDGRVFRSEPSSEPFEDSFDGLDLIFATFVRS